MTLSIMTHSIMTLSIMPFSIITLSNSIMTLSHNHTQDDDIEQNHIKHTGTQNNDT